MHNGAANATSTSAGRPSTLMLSQAPQQQPSGRSGLWRGGAVAPALAGSWQAPLVHLHAVLVSSWLPSRRFQRLALGVQPRSRQLMAGRMGISTGSGMFDSQSGSACQDQLGSRHTFGFLSLFLEVRTCAIRDRCLYDLGLQ
jgi:hypothetical protein